MTEPLEPAVVAALNESGAITPDGRAVVIAALAGPNALDRALAAIPSSESESLALHDSASQGAGAAQVYLRGVTVSGFRGIGDAVELRLAAGPGLVLVTGRNGSGKSSIAEACELALSGESVRALRSPMWSEGLTNLHVDGGAAIELSLHIDGAGDVTVTCELDDNDVAAARLTARAAGTDYDLEQLGWSTSISRYRPVLTYGELAALASAKPKELYDPINNMVGLERLTAADVLLTKASTEQARPPKQATSALKALTTTLMSSPDLRAAELSTALAGVAPDTTAARAVLAGDVGASAQVRLTLREWAGLTAPDAEAAAEAAAALTAALERRERAGQGATGRAARLAQMLELAIQHRQHDDDRCPVCGEGVLGAAWLKVAREQARQAREAAAESTAAAQELRVARERVQQHMPAAPVSLTNGQPIDGVDPAEAASAWAALREVDDPSLPEAERDAAVAVGLEAAVRRLANEISVLASAAAAALEAQDTAWEPIAEQARETLRLLDAAEAARARHAAVTEAREWLRVLTTKLRGERMRRFRDQATAIWNGLRQESNVSLDGIELVGSNTRRHARLDLSVDGTPGPQAVLSQGELAALGLALFLPRSTADDSPFRFVLIDDPVQSMDPSKIDGLARVLHGLAESRQVVVFTHDDRLLQALQRLALPVTAFKIVRGERSLVKVERVADPVEQHLRDARALAKDAALPDDLVAIAVTGCCRDAIDEVANEVGRRRLLDTGLPAADVDDRLASAGTTYERLALALLGDRRRTGKPVNAALDTVDPDARAVITACVEGVHQPDPTALLALPDRTAAVVAALRSA